MEEATDGSGLLIVGCRDYAVGNGVDDLILGLVDQTLDLGEKLVDRGDGLGCGIGDGPSIVQNEI